MIYNIYIFIIYIILYIYIYSNAQRKSALAHPHVYACRRCPSDWANVDIEQCPTSVYRPHITMHGCPRQFPLGRIMPL